MRKRLVNGHMIETDGITVWVNAPDGTNSGRFGARGVDVHTNGDDGTHCDDCFVRTADAAADWRRFVEGIARVHGVQVPDNFRPS